MSGISLNRTQINAGLLEPAFWWNSNVITYSIPDGSTSWVNPYPQLLPAWGFRPNEPYSGYYSELSPTQRSNFVVAMELWDSYIARDLNQVADGATYGDIRVAFTNVDFSGGQAYAYGPSYQGGTPVPENGDVWIGYQKTGSSFAQGTQDFQLLLHEIGHALGLKHPFENPALPAQYDNHAYTVMSYTPADTLVEVTVTGNSYRSTYTPTVDRTPMVLDIDAVQNRYGADPTTNLGNTTYSFTDASTKSREAIYDAGGIDTFDLSALSRGSTIDLRSGAYSDVNYYSVAQQKADLQSAYPFVPAGSFDSVYAGQNAYEWTKNVGIAFRTVIENVIGSNHADVISGSNYNNQFKGGGGADRLYGFGGDDVLIGGPTSAGAYNQLWGGDGSDTASYEGTGGTVHVDLRAQVGRVNGAVVDTMNSIENATGGSANDVLIGTNFANVLKGGSGNDALYGFDGHDVLQGGAGNDQLWGGGGLDWADYSDQNLAVRVNLGNQSGTGAGAGTDTFNSVENARGGAGADLIYGSGIANLVEGGGARDILYGFAGADTFVYRAASDSRISTGYDTIGDFERGIDKLDLDAFGISASKVLIASSGGSTSLYADTSAATAGYELAISFLGSNAITTADIIF